ncbi:MAG: thioredoxin [Proteobacteria bacterium]|nr:thioredoxin [Pseudomonadota bacterium]
MEPILGAAKADGGAVLVKETDLNGFVTDVIEASRKAPVIVDFWAPWCGPCKTLGPALEKAVREAKGAVRMVKVNIDENPEIAQQMRIQSIPAVFAFKDGRPVDGFVGAVPESQIKAFIKRLAGEPAPSPVTQALEQAKAALTAGDFGTASTLFGQVLAREPANPVAVAGLARCYLKAGDRAKAKQMLDALPPEALKDPDVIAARAALDLAQQGAAATGKTDELKARLERDPKDHAARHDLATALFAAGQQAEAVDQALELFRRERKWNEEAARKQLLKFFEALGPTHELTVTGRKRLSSLMFA